MQDAAYKLSGTGRFPLRGRDGRPKAWASVDLEDFKVVNRHHWKLSKGGYVYRTVKKTSGVLLHRFLLGLSTGDGLHTDHINRDRLDNRRSNLRVLTQAQNNQNTGGWRKSSSQYRGVCWFARDRKWQAEVTVNRKVHYLGRFDSEEKAAQVAADFRRLHMPHNVEDAWTESPHGQRAA